MRRRRISNMKPKDFAIIGVRLVGLACLAVSVVLAMSAFVLAQQLSSTFKSTDLHLHDTYVVNHSASLIPAACAAIVGSVLLLLSQRFGKLISRGLDGSEI